MEADHLCPGCMTPKGGDHICANCGWIEGTPPESTHHLPPGTVIKDRYLLGRVLGQGGFGITYLAWDEMLGTRVAIKEFLPLGIATRVMGQPTIAVLKSGEMETLFAYGIERFLDEARTLARFEDYPGIVSVRDVFRDNGTAYMVMQYLEGVTLKEYLARRGGAVPYGAAVEIMMPVLDTLREVHQAGILHRDISPDNIFLTKGGQVKVLDFGAARHAMGEQSRSLSVVLKAGYAPEEQYRSRGRQGEYTDVYSVAATMYQLITGQVPLEALDRLSEDTLQAPGQLGIDIPTGVEEALMKALSVTAAQRYQSIKEFQEALLNAGEPIERAETAERPVSDTGEAGIAPAAEAEAAAEPVIVDHAAQDSPPADIPGAVFSKPSKKVLIAAAGIVLLAAGVWYAVGQNQDSTEGPAVSQGAAVQAPPALSQEAAAVENQDTGEKPEPALPGNESLPRDKPQEKITLPKKQNVEAKPLPAPSNIEGATNSDVTYGKYTFSDGAVYEGEFKNGVCHGQGTLTWPDGSRYVGEFRDGWMNGQGTMTYPNGLKYVGAFKDNLSNGRGALTSPDGNRYEGEFKDNLPHGRGTWTFPDGSKYIGEFKNGLQNGYGTATYSNGLKYDGEWRDGKENGWGAMTFPDGAVYSGVFKDGLPVQP